MTPDWENKEFGVQLYCRDCLDVLPYLSKVGAVITDPPFGIDFKYHSHKDKFDGYGKWLWRIIEKCETLCIEGSPIFVWQAMLNCRHFSNWFPRNYRIFAACRNFVQMYPIAMQHSFDPVIVWWTNGEQWSAKELNRDFHVADTSPSTRKKGAINYVKDHPCPRPLFQIKHIIEQWVKNTSVCLDPFMGSGTTGVACVLLGRKFIGIEKVPKYFEICIKRIEEAIEQRKKVPKLPKRNANDYIH